MGKAVAHKSKHGVIGKPESTRDKAIDLNTQPKLLISVCSGNAASNRGLAS
jgi:hypothetical protein